MSTKLPRHVLITGGSRGIGLAIAQLFAKNNYRCTLIARNEDALKAAVSALQPLQQPSPPESAHRTSPLTGPITSDPNSSFSSVNKSLNNDSHPPPSSPYTHRYIPGSLTSSQFWLSTFLPHLPCPKSHTTSRIDVLINCAGISQSRLFLKTGDDVVQDIISTNLMAVMTGTRYLMRNGYLRGDRSRDNGGEGEGGPGPSIINVSSLLALHGGFGTTAYSASKAGLLGFTRALATEYASHRVRVNAIVPGYISTDMTRELNQENLEKRIPMGRFGKPEEVAKAALFLAENGYAHNCVVGIDGGLSAV